MKSAFKTTKLDDFVKYDVRGYWGDQQIVTSIRGSIFFSLSNNRNMSEVKSDVDAAKNFHAALGHAIETVEGLESE